MDGQNMDHIVELSTPDGRTFQFRLGMALEWEENTYVVLIELLPDANGEEQILITRVETMEDGSQEYAVVDDEATIEAVFQQYTALSLGETLASLQAEEECDCPDCGCGHDHDHPHRVH